MACLLILTLVVPGFARERTPLEQVRKITRGSRVVVTLKDKQTLKGRLGELRQDRFMLEPDVSGTLSNRELLFQEVREIRRVREHSIMDYIFEHDFMIPIALAILPFVLLYCGAFHQDCGSFP